ncbi:MAG: Holliday junction branch migration protein RuvA [Dehalococcoidia bacterium]|nr:Holliday junction branch migration protein RuvA [Dehalococcoidia bacterium]MBS19640.1 Holliday junction branch migration protein RuvA [Chloroflexota bacterium]|tara:strand:- start:524 stop:1108 length:585 start_codon:yes stop_codon:yes gene_type:complete
MSYTLVSSVKGRIESMTAEYVDISVSLLTLRIIAPTSTLENIGPIGTITSLLTSLQVREDSLTLYGFLTEDDRVTFETLIAINGVGPKLAIAILSKFSASALANLVQSGDTKTFTTVPGVGGRTASRILLELKGKMDHIWTIPYESDISDEVFESLTALGYSTQEAQSAISSIKDSELSTEEKLRLSLQFLTSR